MSKAHACLTLIIVLISFPPAFAQIAMDEFVTYEKESSFIHEFPIPLQELGLRGIAVDSGNNAWAYHSTNVTSTILRFDAESRNFTHYPVEGKTEADNAVINLAVAHLAFDEERNAIWFTDARINSVGRLDLETGQISTSHLTTPNAGPMGISISPDGNTIWFTEIIGDKIGKIDAESMKITEYATGENSGPALLTFDEDGILWATLSFSRAVLRIDTSALPASNAMSELGLPSEPAFSPFGIAVSNGKIYVSDHGSSRVIVSDLGFAKYDSYWTSPAEGFPTTLPGEIASDSKGNIYFPQHGGNRITAIENTGVMTEYEIPTGPLSTALFISAAVDGKVWFTEWASNKIAYLDTTLRVPITLDVNRNSIALDRSDSQSIAISIASSGGQAYPSSSEVEVSLIGMTESGLRGIKYEAEPPRLDLQNGSSAESVIKISADDRAISGNYVAMVRASILEKDGLVISKLYPVELVLKLPEPFGSQQNNQQIVDTTIQDVLRIAAPVGVAVVIALAVYRWRKSRNAEPKP